MGRKKRPAVRRRIPLQVDQRVTARAEQHNVEITAEYVDLLEFALKYKDQLADIHFLGDMSALLEDYARLKGKRRK